VEADFSVELGPEDAVLEFPWAASEGFQYYDLKRHPELLPLLDEARRSRPLADFLAAVNSTSSPFETAKCDVWFTSELNPEEEIFGAAAKFGSYVDVLFSGEFLFSFSAHEDLVKRWTRLLTKAPNIPAAAEFVIRRCDFKNDPRDGFYITVYAFGYGDNKDSAREQWTIALKLVENAIRQATVLSSG
jgi:hypothetical protein